MIDAYREKLKDLLVSRGSQARMDEAGFFFEEFKPLDPALHRAVETNKNAFYFPVYAGIALGFGLSLSLRRYFAAFRLAPLSVRILLDFALVTSSTSYAIWTAAVPRFLLSIHGLRCELITKNDPQYLAHLKRKFRTFPDLYAREIRVFQEVLEEEDFLNWFADSPQYVFEPGQTPQPQDFRDKDRFLKLLQQPLPAESRGSN